MTIELDASAGAAPYNRASLLAYDLWVLGLSNRYAWQCPTEALLRHFSRHVGARHLDIGVGTGYLLDHCQFPVANPEIVLADLNPASLAAASHRIRHLHPVMHELDVLQPFKLAEAPFDSVSMNYLLHCLPGTLVDKAPAIAHGASQLKRGGILFGATILGEGVIHNIFGQMLMRAYNWRGIFSNRQDSVATLQQVLEDKLRDVEIQIIGRVALFSGRRR